MATNYTANYGLCQWEPGDNFVREEFNQDNAKIDAAIKAAEEEIAAAETRSTERLATVSHDVYGLMLQNYYDGKTTGWKKALFFDGFQDKKLVSQASENLLFTDKTVSLCRNTEAVVGTGYSDEATGQTSWRQSAHFSVNSCGYLTQVRFQTLNTTAESEQISLQYSVLLNYQSVQSGSFITTFKSTPTENILPVNNVKVKPGDKLCLHLYNKNDTHLLYRPGTGDGTLGCYFDLTSVTGESGAITTPALALPDRSSLWAWIRHDGGNFTLTALGQNGEQEVFVPVGMRTAQKVDGTPCTELELKLEHPPKEGNLTFQLQLELGESPWINLYDYGILVL